MQQRPNRHCRGCALRHVRFGERLFIEISMASTILAIERLMKGSSRLRNTARAFQAPGSPGSRVPALHRSPARSPGAWHVGKHPRALIRAQQAKYAAADHGERAGDARSLTALFAVQVAGLACLGRRRAISGLRPLPSCRAWYNRTTAHGVIAPEKKYAPLMRCPLRLDIFGTMPLRRYE